MKPGELFLELASIIMRMDEYLDSEVSPDYKAQPLAQDWARVAKCGEESGEAIDALIGVTAQNPRKGEYSSKEELYAELADVALTGMYGLQHFTKNDADTLEIILARARYHCERVGV